MAALLFKIECAVRLGYSTLLLVPIVREVLAVLPSIVREVLGKSRKHISGVVCMVFRSCSWCNG